MVDQEKIDLLKQLRTNAKISISKKMSTSLVFTRKCNRPSKAKRDRRKKQNAVKSQVVIVSAPPKKKKPGKKTRLLKRLLKSGASESSGFNTLVNSGTTEVPVQRVDVSDFWARDSPADSKELEVLPDIDIFDIDIENGQFDLLEEILSPSSDLNFEKVLEETSIPPVDFTIVESVTTRTVEEGWARSDECKNDDDAGLEEAIRDLEDAELIREMEEMIAEMEPWSQ